VAAEAEVARLRAELVALRGDAGGATGGSPPPQPPRSPRQPLPSPAGPPPPSAVGAGAVGLTRDAKLPEWELVRDDEGRCYWWNTETDAVSPQPPQPQP
jgi:hypothetical protein